MVWIGGRKRVHQGAEFIDQVLAARGIPGAGGQAHTLTVEHVERECEPTLPDRTEPDHRLSAVSGIALTGKQSIGFESRNLRAQGGQ